jgi:hypothetical protein
VWAKMWIGYSGGGLVRGLVIVGLKCGLVIVCVRAWIGYSMG